MDEKDEPKAFGGPTTVDRSTLDVASAQAKRAKDDPVPTVSCIERSGRIVWVKPKKIG